MNYWIREVVGWLLIALGLMLFYTCYRVLTDGSHAILEGCALALVGIIVFRGGIHLLKIAVAARVYLETRQQLEDNRPTSAVAPRVPSRSVTSMPVRHQRA